jgi:hypothetical protein
MVPLSYWLEKAVKNKMENIVVLILSSIAISSTAISIMFYFKYRKLIGVIAQLILDKEVLADKLNESLSLNSKEFNDGFIKFLSESRESAFTYIESVQGAIKNYLDATNKNDNDAIVTARMELFSHLPEPMDKV